MRRPKPIKETLTSADDDDDDEHCGRSAIFFRPLNSGFGLLLRARSLSRQPTATTTTTTVKATARNGETESTHTHRERASKGTSRANDSWLRIHLFLSIYATARAEPADRPADRPTTNKAGAGAQIKRTRSGWMLLAANAADTIEPSAASSTRWLLMGVTRLSLSLVRWALLLLLLLGGRAGRHRQQRAPCFWGRRRRFGAHKRVRLKSENNWSAPADI